MENLDVSYRELRQCLAERNIQEKDIEVVIDVISQLKYDKARKTAQTLKERADNGLVCGRPKFNKPIFFRAICIYHQLGYFDINAIVRVFNISRSTFYKYERLENITGEELKNNSFRQPSQRQIDLYLRSAEKNVIEWIRKNKPSIARNRLDDLKNDCLVSIFLKLPTYDYGFDIFCNRACRDTYCSLREKYTTERKETLMGEDWHFDKLSYKEYQK